MFILQESTCAKVEKRWVTMKATKGPTILCFFHLFEILLLYLYILNKNIVITCN